MPLVVPLLRLAMLFLNIYESYKTLKAPLPSARNEGRPSQRALTQRKRDMKGCLAVWIVWCCFMTYEGYVERLISLFVPFYDEIKSLGLIFLIMTRARGAEPIFLHVIRPFVKPYTTTIDMFLDVARMVGDIIFAVLTIPTEYVTTWWKTSMFYTDEVLDSETEGTQSPSSPTARASAANLKRAAVEDQRGQRPVLFPKKSNTSRRPSGGDRRPSQTRPKADKVGQHVEMSESTASRQVWYPPPSAYSDDEDTHGPVATISGLPPAEPDTGFLSSEAMREKETVDEWRQYPAFPSAYPPTPIAAPSATLPSTTRAPPLASSLMLSEILEDAPQQDFNRSLLPPRKPLNPGLVGDLSDENKSPGVPSIRLESMSVDSDSEADDEEDIFNTTLQTPMPPLRVTRSGVVPIIPVTREVSMASSVASRSTVLTTTGHGSSLRTQSSSESLSSGAVSLSDLSSVLGKKRPLPLDSLDSLRRAEAAEGKTVGSRSGSLLVPKGPLRRNHVKTSSRPVRGPRPDSTLDEDTQSTSSSGADCEGANERKSAYPKRRKVILSPGRTANVRPVRLRVSRYATAPTKVQIPKSKPVAQPRGPSRLHTRSTAASVGSAVPSDASAASISSVDDSSLPTNSRGTRPKAKATIPSKSQQSVSRP